MNEEIINKIIQEIIEIQNQPYVNSISALGKKIRVEKLHKQLDEHGYKGERPPLIWNQLNSKNDE